MRVDSHLNAVSRETCTTPPPGRIIRCHRRTSLQCVAQNCTQAGCVQAALSGLEGTGHSPLRRQVNNYSLTYGHADLSRFGNELLSLADSASVLANRGYAARPYFCSQQFRPEQQDQPNIGASAFLLATRSSPISMSAFMPCRHRRRTNPRRPTEGRAIPRGSSIRVSGRKGGASPGTGQTRAVGLDP